MKNTMTRILLLAAAMVLALSLCLVGHAEEEAAEAVSTSAYIFWQDADWWPAATNNNDDYWEPIPATVTGEGWYTVGLKAHMPSWFYPSNHNTGAQKLAVVITDGNDLFPGMYMQIVDIRIDGVSYPCGDVTYGQTGYDNTMDGGVVGWKSNDTYGLIYDQWMIDNAGTVGTGNTWSSTATAQKFDVFDVSALNDPSTIEIDFFLSSQQDVKPEGAPALRVLSEGPATYTEIKTVEEAQVTPENATTAKLYYQAGGWWPETNGVLGVAPEVTLKGEGEYTLQAYFVDQGGWVPKGNGAEKLVLVVDNGGANQGTAVEGMYIGVSDVRVNGQSIKVGNAAFGPTGYDNGTLFDSNDGYMILYDRWMIENQPDVPWGHETWDGSEGTTAAIDPADLVNVSDVEVDIFVTDTKGELPEAPDYDYTWYSNNTMGVAGYNLRDDLGIGNKWYNVVPVDMTKDGIYKIPLIASNCYVIGNAIVTVEGDNVTVDYVVQGGNVNVTSECMKWFASTDEITADFVNAPESDQVFGEAYSKADLGNVAYLFICNRVTYSQPATVDGVFLAEYYHGEPIWKAYRAGLDAMVAELTAVVESPEAGTVDSPAADVVDSPVAE